jgi:hypothetical protein
MIAAAYKRGEERPEEYGRRSEKESVNRSI